MPSALSSSWCISFSLFSIKTTVLSCLTISFLSPSCLFCLSFAFSRSCFSLVLIWLSSSKINDCFSFIKYLIYLQDNSPKKVFLCPKVSPNNHLILLFLPQMHFVFLWFLLVLYFYLIRIYALLLLLF